MSYAEFFEQYQRRRRPVIIEGAVADWQAVARWTPDFFRSRYGSMSVEIDGRSYTLAELIDHAERSTPENPGPYLHNKYVRDQFPDLEQDITPWPEYYRRNWFFSPLIPPALRPGLLRAGEFEIFIGGPGSAFPRLHVDAPNTHAFACQIYGVKQYVVYPPEQSEYMYPEEHRPHQSPLSPFVPPDLDRFPLFAKAVPLEGTVRPGDVLFNPTGWWHSARNLTVSITVIGDIGNASNWSDITQFVSAHKGPLKALRNRAFMFALGAVERIREGYR
jgi:hypothetical protein